MASNESSEHEGHEDNERLHIFVNRRRFEEKDGVKHAMTGAAIAGLVDVPPQNAVVRWDSGPEKGDEIPVEKTVRVKNGDHFIVTRKVVEGG